MTPTKEITAQEKFLDEIYKYFTDTIYVCTRDKSAWGYGTMRLDDFERAWESDDVMNSIGDIFEKHVSQVRQQAFSAGRLQGLKEMHEAHEFLNFSDKSKNLKINPVYELCSEYRQE